MGCTTRRAAHGIPHLRARFADAVPAAAPLPITPWLWQLLDDACLCRYLRARNWNAVKAKTLLDGTLKCVPPCQPCHARSFTRTCYESPLTVLPRPVLVLQVAA